MNYSGRAPSKKTVTAVPELPEASSDNAADKHQKSVATFRLLWDHRRMLFRVGLYAVLAGIAIALLIPNRYQSTAHLMPPDSQSTSGLAMAAAAMTGSTGASALGGMASDLLGMKSNSDVFVGILSSRTAQDKLISQFDLQKLYGAERMEDARKQLADRTSVSVERKSQIIAIEVTDKSPQRAAAICQAYVDQLNILVSQLSTSSARRERIFLEGRLEGVRRDLDTAEKNFSQFSSKNSTIDVKEQGRAMVGAAAVMQGNLIAAQSEYEGLRQIYTDSNVRVRAVRARIVELQHQLQVLAGKGESTTDLGNLPSETLYPSMRKLPLLGVAYADLYREAKIQETVLEILTRQYEMAKVQEAKEIPTVKILDTPQIPDKKSYPPRLLIVFICTVLALTAATIWLFAATTWRQTDAHDTRKVFAQEVFMDVRSRLPAFLRDRFGDQDGGKGFLIRRGGPVGPLDKDESSE
ncbi:MAG: Wzz/FepE/Etk N-terminal domain-containing protein [Acidobacteriota bacterium]|nr:Wzz/FepE/Etk N-terminal domain-containing protein [Acidobacteriota bacterium]